MMFHVEQPPSSTHSTALDNARAARGRQQQSDETIQVYRRRQYECENEKCQVFFTGSGKIFLKARSLRQQQSDETKQWAGGADYTVRAYFCQVLFAAMCKIILIGEGLGAGLTIGENYGKLQKIKLDTTTPRAAPRNWLALFFDQERKKELTTLLYICIICT